MIHSNNGLLSRRHLLQAMQATAGAVAGSSIMHAAHAEPSAHKAYKAHKEQTSRRTPGVPMSGYGAPSLFEGGVVRTRIRAQPGTTGAGASSTPLEHLRGTITPNGLHFERHHSGVPRIEPSHHRLIIGGAVERSLSFDLEALERYPMVTRTLFLECSGNSGTMLSAKPQPWGCGAIHGLVSCSEWTGVPLSILLDEAGIDLCADANTGWVIAEGADAARMNRSVPLAKCMDDAMIALYQNGERLRPENGYPMRLLLPGYEGNMSIKWLHRLEVSQSPAMSREETSKYSDLRDDGRASLFTYPMAVKSVITSPSPGLELREPGIYQISGIAWSGAGPITQVDVSADGGRSWLKAGFDSPPQALSLVRFSAALRWRGQRATLLSRATDGTGAQQPMRDDWIASNGRNAFYHCNAIQAWRLDANGSLHNAYV